MKHLIQQTGGQGSTQDLPSQNIKNLPPIGTIVETSKIVLLYPFGIRADTFTFTNQHFKYLHSLIRFCWHQQTRAKEPPAMSLLPLHASGMVISL